MKFPTRASFALVLVPLLLIACESSGGTTWTFAPGPTVLPGEAGSPSPGTGSPDAGSPAPGSPGPGETASAGPDASESLAPATSESPAPEGTPEGLTLEVTTPADDPLTFSESTLTAPAGNPLTVTYRNDSDLPHNIAFFEGSDATAPRMAATEIAPGPGDRQEVAFTAPAEPGSYYFHCDVHPVEMTGTFDVTG